MMDICKILGIKKLNTTAYHPQCDGAVERFNRTLKTILRKHAARFGSQWEFFQGYCGLTATLPIPPLVRSPHSYSSE